MSASLLLQITVKVSIFLAMAWLATRVMRRSSAAARHFVWAIAIVGILLVPMMVLVGPVWNLSVLPATDALRSTQMAAPGGATKSDADPVGSRAAAAIGADTAAAPSSLATLPDVPQVAERGSQEGPAVPETSVSSVVSQLRRDWRPVLLGLWAAGVTFVLLRLGIGIVWVCWIAHGAEPVTDTAWLTILDELTSTLGIRGRVSLRRSDRTTVPVACGLWRPTLLMPMDADEWSADRRRVVLLHELAHVKRRDCRLQAIAQLACAWHWFNPLAHVAVARLRAEQERACDDLVLAAGTDGPAYADHLFEIARAFRFDPLPRWAMLAMAAPSQLEDRVLAILDAGRRRHTPTRLTRTMGAVAAAVAVVSLGAFRLSAATAGSSDAADEAAQNVFLSDAARTDVHVTDSRGEAGGVLIYPPDATLTSPLDAAAPDVALLAAQGPRVTINPWVDGLAVEPQFDFVPPLPPFDIDPDPNPDFDFQFDFNFDSLSPVPPMPPIPPMPPVVGSAGMAKPQAADAVPDETRRRVADALSLALNDENERVREQAIQGLATMRDPRAVPALIKALQSRDVRLRRIAVGSLSQFDTPEAAQGLVTALKDENADVRRQAIRALGRRRDDKYADALVTAMRDENPDVRRQAVAALGRSGQSAAVVTALVQALKDSNADVRQRAAASLARTRSPEAVPGLIAALKDANPEVRQMSAVALGAIADARAIDALTAALKDTDPQVRERAAIALSRIARGQRRGPGSFPIADFNFKQFEREIAKVQQVEREKIHRQLSALHLDFEKGSAAAWYSDALDPRELVDAAMRQADKAFKQYDDNWRQLEQDKGLPEPGTKDR
jgi:HEAT repeat protein/beta-lactamase regulating signal transducer with metallopeptidase domain